MNESREQAGSTKFTDHPNCPRCGYDLGGVVSMWEGAGCCPVEGRCSECGLEFEWGLVFTDSAHTWLFEYDARHKLVRRFLRTVLMTCRPWRFWREVALTDQTYLRRLCLLPAILLAVLFVLRFAEAYWWHLEVGTWGAWARPTTWDETAKWFVGNIWAGSGRMTWDGSVAPFFLGTLGATLSWSLLLLLSFKLMPVSIRRARVSNRHLWRVSIYTYVPAIVLLIGWSIAGLLADALYHWVGFPMDWFRTSEQTLDALISTIGWFSWQSMCWFIACRHYLKLPHAFGIASLLTITSGLMLGVIAILWMNQSMTGSF